MNNDDRYLERMERALREERFQMDLEYQINKDAEEGWKQYHIDTRWSEEEDAHSCARDHCSFCGNCHEVLNACFTEACDQYETACVRCLQWIFAGTPKRVCTGPHPGWYHTACYEQECADQAAGVEAERKAEIRNEEILYGYELPQYES